MIRRMSDDEHKCPVCGWQLHEEAWAYHAPSGTWNPSWEICACCGTEFGYQDNVPGDDPSELSTEHRSIRNQWISDGSKWHSTVTQPPAGWDPVAQLHAAGLAETDSH